MSRQPAPPDVWRNGVFKYGVAAYRAPHRPPPNFLCLAEQRIGRLIFLNHDSKSLILARRNNVQGIPAHVMQRNGWLQTEERLQVYNNVVITTVGQDNVVHHINRCSVFAKVGTGQLHFCKPTPDFI